MERWVQHMAEAVVDEATRQGIDPDDEEALRPIIDKHFGVAPNALQFLLAEDYLNEAFKLLEEENPELYQRLEEAIERGDRPEVTRLAHEAVAEVKKIRGHN